MKLNKKGTTIVELVVSVALLSIIVLFMYNLLSDITFERDSEYFASENQEQRIEIEQAINDEIFKCYAYKGYTLKWDSYTLYCNYNSSIDPGNIIMTVDTSSLQVKVNNYTYKDDYSSIDTSKTTTTTYDLKSKNVTGIDIKTDNTDDSSKTITYDQTDANLGKTINQIKILIYTDNDYNNSEKTNNTIDDIVFSYISE